MKKSFLLIVFLIFYPLSNSYGNGDSSSDYLARMLKNIQTLRNSGSPDLGLLFILETEIATNRLTYTDIDSSEQEFKNIRVVICINGPQKLFADIKKTAQPLPKITELETLLIACGLSYKDVDINYSELYEQRKRGFMFLALEARNRYDATQNDVFWYRHLEYIQAGGFTSEEYGELIKVPWDMK